MAISAEKKGLTLKIAELLAAPSNVIETNISHDPIPRPRIPAIPKRARENFDGFFTGFLNGENKKTRKRINPTNETLIAFADSGEKYLRLNPNPNIVIPHVKAARIAKTVGPKCFLNENSGVCKECLDSRVALKVLVVLTSITPLTIIIDASNAKRVNSSVLKMKVKNATKRGKMLLIPTINETSALLRHLK